MLCAWGCEGHVTCVEGAGGCALDGGGSEWCAMCAGFMPCMLFRMLFCMLLCILEAV